MLEVRNMIAEAESDHNDGYAKRWCKNRLIMLKEILDSCITQDDMERFKKECKDKETVVLKE
jgi:hypothetical protein